MASLFVIQGRDQGKRFNLNDGVSTVGRDISNAIQLHDHEVSRRHAEVRRERDEYLLVDLSSANGTFINSQRVRSRPLSSGDRIQVGRTLLIFTASEDAVPTDMEGKVDIVGPPTGARGDASGAAGSRIVQSISQEAVQQEASSRILPPSDDVQSPWLARARSNLQIMYHTALAVSHTLDIDQLLQRIMDLIFEWVEADRGCIMLIDSATGQPIPKARRNRRGVSADEKIIISRTILDYVMNRKEGVLTSDARDDERFDAAGSIVKMGVREAICTPMQGRYGVVGVIYIDTYTSPGRQFLKRAPNKFSEEHLKLMVAIGHQAALAIEDTSYYSAMVQAERLAAMGQTIATLSHHIKNILQGIRGGSYLIEEGLKGNDHHVLEKGWRIVEKNQEKISNLVMDMLTFSKEREPDMTSSSLNQTVADVVELLQSRATEAGVELVWRPEESMPQLTFDVDGLERAILNVVTNAVDACENRPAAQVQVSTRLIAAKGVAQIIVEDNGAGIAPEDLEKVFSLFESGKGSRGTGLGLAVSRKILEEHNGDIHVESTPGVGSRFFLELPAVPPDAAGSMRNTETIS